MIYFLFDNPADKQNMEFLKEYDTASFNLMFPREQCKSVKSMLKACNNCIRISAEGDTIICWYDFMGILCWWLCRILHKKRDIIVLNILLKDKQSLKNKATRMLYKSALKSKNVRATVTSKEYGLYLNKLLGIRKQYILLHDIYHSGYNVGYADEIEKNSVFCGGRNGRDWEFLLKLAEKMSDIKFNIVVSKEQFQQYEEKLGKNVNVKTEISELKFLELMCQSSFVLMPLDTEAPAGLIVMFQAGANRKLVITSDTVTTREYFADNRGVLCKKSINEWSKQIRYWLEHTKEAQERTKKFQCFLENECSEKKYAETLQQLIK